jgi:peptide/nickel transport system substrate-binding protein
MKRSMFLLLVGPLLVSVLAAGCAATPTLPIAKETATARPTATLVIVPATPTSLPTLAPTLPTITPTPKPLDTLIIGLRSEPDVLHPLVSTMFAKDIVNSALFASCTRENERLEWVPEMCESVPTLQNGGAKWVGEGAERHLEVTFTLKKNWQWHDGTPVTAKDYVFTWQLALDPDTDSYLRENWLKIQDVVALDDQTVVFKYHSEKTLAAAAAGQGKFPALKAEYAQLQEATPTGPLVNPFYYALGSPLPTHILAQVPAKDQYKSDFAYKPIGNGAYKFKAWQPGEQIELEANADFPLGAPKIKKLVFRFTPRWWSIYKESVLSELQKGELDIVTQDGPLSVDMGADLDELAKAGYKVYLVPTFSWEHVDLNTTRFPFDDARVRRALAYATDKQALVNQLYFGKLPIAHSFLPSFHWAYDDAAVVKYEYSLEKAQALLKEAGWDCTKSPCTRKTAAGQTQTLAFTLVTTDQPDRQQRAQVLKQQWSKAGFGVNLQFLYGHTLFAPAEQGGPLTARTFDAAMYTWVSSDDPDITGLYACQSIPSLANKFAGQNYPGWCNKAVDGKLVAASADPDTLVDKEKRQALLSEVQKAWTTDVPVIPLFNTVWVSAARVGLKGYTPTPLDNSPEFWNAWQWEWSK